MGCPTLGCPILPVFFFFGDKKEEKGHLFLFHGRKRGGALGHEEFSTVKSGAWRIYHMGCFSWLNPIPNKIQDLGQILTNSWIQS